MIRDEIERMFQYNMTNAFIKWDKVVNAEYKEENEDAFYQGAYSAQKYLIDKVCEWLWEHFYDHPHIKSFVCTESFGDSEEMIECFKAAMEE